MSDSPRHAADTDGPAQDDVSERSQLLPEEEAVGSDDPRAQAEAVLAESIERTEHPNADDSTQTGPRSSDEAT